VSGIYTIGLFMGGTGLTAMKNTAMYGSFDNNLSTWPGGTTGFPAGTCTMTDCGSGKGSGCTAIPASAPNWDKDGNGVPDTFYSTTNALEIKDSVISAILEILQQATSGTAVSILASGEGNGANLIQAFFYPRKSFVDTDITWVGEMQNLWYYLDPKLQVSTIREDTDSDAKLELKNDYVIHFRFDTALNKTRVDLSKDVNGDGSVLTFQKTVDLEQTKNLWEAGKTLWARNLSTSPRTLYTTTNGSSLSNFSTASAATLKDYLQASTTAEATNIINYLNGTDVTGYRDRTVSIDLNANGVINAGETNVWKLGDIISSTPKTESWVRLNTYDSEAPNGYADSSYWQFINSLDYDGRGTAYVGANDGILHAFNFGITDVSNNTSDKFEIAHLRSTANLGKEMWGFIPKNSLPYLKYMTDPNYCHLFYLDATPYIFDASINIPSDCGTGDYTTCPKKTVFTKDGLGNDTHYVDFSKTSWKTVLISGMGVGGACRAATGTCATGNCSSTTATSCTLPTHCPSGETCILNCVKTPIMDPADNTKGLGYSSYYALDVTNPQSPALLWEFSNPALGFSTSGPAVIRVGDGTSNGKKQNGNWYAVFASGPTGPIHTGLRQFMGKSDQNLKLFIVNLKTGALVRTIDTGLTNAFAGSLKNATLDADRWRTDRVGNYSDDVLYIGYTQQSGTNWVGGVLRLTTGDANGENKDVSKWNVSTVISGIGPVTAAVTYLMDRTSHRLWLYFGTGRYFYKVGTLIDDATAQQKIYGVKEPCYSATNDKFDLTCTTSVSGLTDATTSPPSSEPTNGWYISLDPSGTANAAERVISNPVAAFTGGVFFATFAPTSNICGYNGNTYLWLVNYATGGVAPSSSFIGTALLQISTGEIKEVSLKDAITNKVPPGETQGREGNVGVGILSREGFSVITSPKPIKKILHMQER
jgi:type IV pilus assembly protein PilY1